MNVDCNERGTDLNTLFYTFLVRLDSVGGLGLQAAGSARTPPDASADLNSSPIPSFAVSRRIHRPIYRLREDPRHLAVKDFR